MEPLFGWLAGLPAPWPWEVDQIISYVLLALWAIVAFIKRRRVVHAWLIVLLAAAAVVTLELAGILRKVTCLYRCNATAEVAKSYAHSMGIRLAVLVVLAALFFVTAAVYATGGGYHNYGWAAASAACAVWACWHALNYGQWQQFAIAYARDPLTADIHFRFDSWQNALLCLFIVLDVAAVVFSIKALRAADRAKAEATAASS